MTIKIWKTFDFSDSWPWALMLTVPTILAALAIRYNYFVTREGIGAAGLITLFSTLTAFYGITAWRYVCRYLFIESIVGYTEDGTAITMSKVARDRVSNASKWEVPVLLSLVTLQMRSVLSFWNTWAVQNSKDPKSTLIFNGCVLDIEDRPIQTVGWSDKLAGLEIGGTIAIAWTTSTLQDIVPILRWETARHCLDAMGYSGATEAEQNLVMHSANFS
jgi:hypothetical protein